jgi:hypothetical protein
VLVNIANGTTFGKKVKVAKLVAGVGCYKPGNGGRTYVGSGETTAGHPSPVRHSSTACAALVPIGGRTGIITQDSSLLLIGNYVHLFRQM